MQFPTLDWQEVVTSFLRLFTFTQSEKRIAILALSLSVVSRGLGIFAPGYSIDDWRSATQPPSLAPLASGRPVYILLREIFDYLGVTPPSASLLGSVAMALVLVWAGLLVCRHWGIDGSPSGSAIVVLLFCLHPYHAEMYTWRATVLLAALAIALSFAALSLASRHFLSQALSVVLMTLSLLTYQISLGLVVMTMIFSLGFYLAHKADSLQDINPPQEVFPAALKSQLAMLFIAVGVYFIVLSSYGLFSPIPITHRGGFLALTEIGLRLEAAQVKWFSMFFLDEPLLPVATKWLLLGTPVFVILLSLASRSWRSAWPVRIKLIVPLLVTIALGIPATLGVLLLTKSWWPMPRSTSQISIFWAGLFV